MPGDCIACVIVVLRPLFCGLPVDMIDIPPSTAVKPVTPVTFQCVLEAASTANVPASALFAILWVEGGHPGEAHRNRNGTYDLGPMQINSIWIPALRRAGFTRRDLKDSGCMNVLAGAAILRTQLARSGRLAQALGDYHSRKPAHHNRYLKRIIYFFNQFLPGRIRAQDVLNRVNYRVTGNRGKNNTIKKRQKL